MNLEMNNYDGQYLSSDVRFYKVEDLIEMTGWSEKTVLSGQRQRNSTGRKEN